MKKFFLTVWQTFKIIFPFAVLIYASLYIVLAMSGFKNELKRQVAVVNQIYNSQVAIYDVLVKTQASNLVIQTELANGLDKAKADAVKSDNQLMQIIYGVDKRSNDRSQGIVDGVNKVVDQVSYALQKPSYDYLKNITVIIVGKAKDYDKEPKGKRGWLGTGVIVGIDKDFTYILTNHHVVQGINDLDTKYNYYVKDEEGDYTLTPIKISKDDNVDLALVRINGHIKDKVAVIGFADIHEQEPIYLVGHDLGRPFFYSEGFCAGFDEDSDFDLVVGAPVGPGNSGSGIINKDGKLVGLLYAGSIIDQEGIYEMDIAHGLAINIKAIRLFLVGYIE